MTHKEGGHGASRDRHMLIHEPGLRQGSQGAWIAHC
jgi:hypothetical protein